MTSFDPEYLARFGHPFKGWDDPRPTKQCLHCNGTGMADPDNECGFCFRTPDSGDLAIRLRSAARSGDLPLGISFDCDAVADEIERLRVDAERADAGVAWLTSKIGHLLAAGDALVAAIRNHNLTEAHLKAWHEARRG